VSEEEFDNTPLAERMKGYERTFRSTLPRRSYTLMRLDGVGFRTYLRGCERPFDRAFVNDMNLLAQHLCEEIQGARFAYTQSDEISLLLTDFATVQTQPWRAGAVQKMVSVAAGDASSYFSHLRYFTPKRPYFDCRVWSMSDPVEVANYFLWRQQDAVRNSIQMVGQTYFSHGQLDRCSGNVIQEMLYKEHGVNWDAFPPELKRGRVTVHAPGEGWNTLAAPHFKAEPDTFLAQEIPTLPRL
jgi:tRNA(His) 5'-end guanylyltransferase